ncbi:MAG: tRNA pseudouridine(55) synthase TruB [Planctomycetes bacterium]|nr:tRNA pseudouridine(55) synthase TruB [Planctomycetota bacterium]
MSGKETRFHGLLIVDKPVGPTSHDVVDDVRRRLRTREVGHTGSLDPEAGGVLVVCVGKALRIVEYLEAYDKAYDAVLRLGVRTDTLDLAGRVLETRPVPPLAPGELEAACERFRGPIEQVPPMYSAIKIGGRKLLDAALAGETLERRPRPVRIHSLHVTRVALPCVEFHLECSKGTYVRSLCDDLGAALGCGGALAALRRTRAGPYGLDRAVLLDRIDEASAPGLLLPLDGALGHLPVVRLRPEARTPFLHGQSPRIEPTALPEPRPGSDANVRVQDADGLLLGIAVLEFAGDASGAGMARLRPRKVLVPPG